MSVSSSVRLPHYVIHMIMTSVELFRPTKNTRQFLFCFFIALGRYGNLRRPCHSSGVIDINLVLRDLFWGRQQVQN
jgi:hypothetical protein